MQHWPLLVLLPCFRAQGLVGDCTPAEDDEACPTAAQCANYGTWNDKVAINSGKEICEAARCQWIPGKITGLPAKSGRDPAATGSEPHRRERTVNAVCWVPRVSWRKKHHSPQPASSLTSRVVASLLGIVGCHSVAVTTAFCVSALLQVVVA
jgi:hypothetical protein